MSPTNPSQLYTTLEQQGQDLYGSDVSNASNYQNQASGYGNQATAANQNLQGYMQSMQGAYNPTTGTGNAGSAYNYELGNLQSQYDPQLQQQLSSANNSLFGLTGALNGATQSFNTPGGVGAYGLSAPALAGYENSVLSPLQQGMGNANTMVNTLNSQLANLMTGANQFTTNTVQNQQNNITGMNNVTQNYLTQLGNAISQQQYYTGQANTQNASNAGIGNAYQNALLTKAQAAVANAEAGTAQSNATTNKKSTPATTTKAPTGNYSGQLNSKGLPVPTTAQTFSPSNIMSTLDKLFNGWRTGNTI